ncbi:LOW QUALITY PROTEIN: eukaryotic translation initiation factor 3 subunit I [Dermatophagoides farinae]|uniref:Eukaryotic translation initiation factor 3 subunit I n=1 Tax=Dermatophagoides farinae TaxID=6954 RepID=A0A922I0F5_DERFA|nr:eukaryotic translation initiation factor 3 subunit I-like [Dermatophagoides farinae]KAH7646316.1 eukaryotic translation initiation factor 3 subunit i-like protein [Dermatophagoides farinae]KAH9516757.1 Eukaryotic translation initiation factor 3 subunit I [Dermatophagoides farinae]
MKPLSLNGHERSITKIRYNLEGDLLFSSSKDNTPNVWYTINGERLGTFDGHTGAVWCIDPKWDSTKVTTGSGDCTLCIWDCETGGRLNVVKTETSVRSALFSYSGHLILYSTDQQMNKPAELNIIDTRIVDENDGITNVFSFTLPSKSKALSSLWGMLDQSFICGMENGKLAKWDLRQPDDPLLETEPHKAQINDLQYNKDQTLFVSASKDNTAKLFDPFTLEHMKTYVTERPVNSASISPIFDHVAVGGGQEAMEVTRTASESGKFESRFFHLIFEEEFARLKGHFGPIQSLAFHPDGRSFATGAEDGYIRIQSFDDGYFNFKMEYE